MASKILKGFAIAAGLGLLIGLGSGKRRRGEIPMNTTLPDEQPSLRPLIERLDHIESRLGAVEARPVAAFDAGSAAELESRIQRQAEEIESLQQQVNDNRQKVDVEIGGIEKRFADVAKAIPAVLESIIVPRVDDLRAHLRAETQQSINSSLTRFERAMDDRISERIDSLEKALLSQSTIVTTLSQRAVETDMNLQRLISAVERLCERTPGAAAPAPAARQEPSLLDLPFEKELKQAVKRQPEISEQPFETAFRPKIIKEDEDTSRRHRIPLARL